MRNKILLSVLCLALVGGFALWAYAGRNNNTATTTSETQSAEDVIVKAKPPDHELIIYIHHAKNKPEKPGQGGASCPSKTFSKWATKNLSFVVNPNGQVTSADGTPLSSSAIVSAVAAGFTPWETASGLAPANVSTFSGLPSTYTQETKNGVNEIAWASLGNKGFANAIAVTYIWRNTRTKLIDEIDMVNNSDSGFSWVNHDVTGDPDTATVPTTGKYDVSNIDTHEFGHFVGLDHVQDGQQTMYGYSGTDEVSKRSLECGDINGIQKLYGL